MVEKPLFQVAFVGVRAERKKIEIVRVFERLLCEVGLWRCQRALEIGDGLAFALI